MAQLEQQIAEKLREYNVLQTASERAQTAGNKMAYGQALVAKAKIGREIAELRAKKPELPARPVPAPAPAPQQGVAAEVLRALAALETETNTRTPAEVVTAVRNDTLSVELGNARPERDTLQKQFKELQKRLKEVQTEHAVSLAQLESLQLGAGVAAIAVAQRDAVKTELADEKAKTAAVLDAVEPGLAPGATPAQRQEILDFTAGQKAAQVDTQVAALDRQEEAAKAAAPLRVVLGSWSDKVYYQLETGVGAMTAAEFFGPGRIVDLSDTGAVLENKEELAVLSISMLSQNFVKFGEALLKDFLNRLYKDKNFSKTRLAEAWADTLVPILQLIVAALVRVAGELGNDNANPYKLYISYMLDVVTWLEVRMITGREADLDPATVVNRLEQDKTANSTTKSPFSRPLVPPGGKEAVYSFDFVPSLETRDLVVGNTLGGHQTRGAIYPPAIVMVDVESANSFSKKEETVAPTVKSIAANAFEPRVERIFLLNVYKEFKSPLLGDHNVIGDFFTSWPADGIRDGAISKGKEPHLPYSDIVARLQPKARTDGHILPRLPTASASDEFAAVYYVGNIALWLAEMFKLLRAKNPTSPAPSCRYVTAVVAVVMFTPVKIGEGSPAGGVDQHTLLERFGKRPVLQDRDAGGAVSNYIVRTAGKAGADDNETVAPGAFSFVEWFRDKLSDGIDSTSNRNAALSSRFIQAARGSRSREDGQSGPSVFDELDTKELGAQGKFTVLVPTNEYWNKSERAGFFANKGTAADIAAYHVLLGEVDVKKLSTGFDEFHTLHGAPISLRAAGRAPNGNVLIQINYDNNNFSTEVRDVSKEYKTGRYVTIAGIALPPDLAWLRAISHSEPPAEQYGALPIDANVRDPRTGRLLVQNEGSVGTREPVLPPPFVVPAGGHTKAMARAAELLAAANLTSLVAGRKHDVVMFVPSKRAVDAAQLAVEARGLVPTLKYHIVELTPANVVAIGEARYGVRAVPTLDDAHKLTLWGQVLREPLRETIGRVYFDELAPGTVCKLAHAAHSVHAYTLERVLEPEEAFSEADRTFRRVELERANKLLDAAGVSEAVMRAAQSTSLILFLPTSAALAGLERLPADELSLVLLYHVAPTPDVVRALELCRMRNKALESVVTARGLALDFVCGPLPADGAAPGRIYMDEVRAVGAFNVRGTHNSVALVLIDRVLQPPTAAPPPASAAPSLPSLRALEQLAAAAPLPAPLTQAQVDELLAFSTAHAQAVKAVRGARQPKQAEEAIDALGKHIDERGGVRKLKSSGMTTQKWLDLHREREAALVSNSAFDSDDKNALGARLNALADRLQ